MAPPKVLLVPHTHWDRAWYWPSERFRVRLGQVFEALFVAAAQDPRWCFTCDGQTLMVEEHLAANPGDAPRLRALAASGRLKLGPMFCLADLYCTGAESLIRNLLLGMATARRLGGEAGLQRTLHMPDTFGIPPELPKIAAGFGLQAFTFMRGHPEEIPELTSMGRAAGAPVCPISPDTRMFLWRADDGSEVRVFRLRDGYANACGLGGHPDPARPQDGFDPQAEAEILLAAARRQAEEDEGGEPLLLLAGVDHQIPPSRLGLVMDAANLSGAFHFVFADLDVLGQALMARLQSALPTFSGEFHGAGAASVLGGTLTTRAYLKQNNAAVERLLCHQAEPAAALIQLLGQPSPATASLPVAWRHLLETHPHDDICGCSVDAVHRANEHQMEQARQAADAVRRACGQRLLQHYGADPAGECRPSFALLNLQPDSQRHRVDLHLDFEGWQSWGDRTLPPAYGIVDEEGAPVPFRELERGQSTEHPRAFARIELYPRLEPGRLTRFYLDSRLVPAAQDPRPAPSLNNGRLEVIPQADGGFILRDLQRGTEWPDLGFFTGQSDVGDSYDFDARPAESECRLVPREPHWERLPSGNGLQALRLRGILPCAGPCPDATDVPQGSVEQAFTLDLSLAEDADTLEVRIGFVSQLLDYRLRWNLGLPRRFRQTTAGLKYDAITRPAGPSVPDADQPPPRVAPEHPADAFFGVQDTAGGLICLSQYPGNYEYVELPGTPPRLAWTVLRAVRWLTNPRALYSRGNNSAGPHTWVPEAQCLGRRMELRFGIRPVAAEESPDLMRIAQLWRAQPIFAQLDPIAAWVERKSTAPSRVLWPKIETRHAVIAACKPAEDRKGVILRLHQASQTHSRTSLELPPGLKAQACGMDELPCQPGPAWQAAPDGRILHLDLCPGQLMSLRLSH